jgi:hypothetical protein
VDGGDAGVPRTPASRRLRDGDGQWWRERQGNGDGAKETVRLRSRSITVTPDDALLNELRELFGADRIRLVRS